MVGAFEDSIAWTFGVLLIVTLLAVAVVESTAPDFAQRAAILLSADCSRSKLLAAPSATTGFDATEPFAAVCGAEALMPMAAFLAAVFAAIFSAETGFMLRRCAVRCSLVLAPAEQPAAVSDQLPRTTSEPQVASENTKSRVQGCTGRSSRLMRRAREESVLTGLSMRSSSSGEGGRPDQSPARAPSVGRRVAGDGAVP